MTFRQVRDVGDLPHKAPACLDCSEARRPPIRLPCDIIPICMTHLGRYQIKDELGHGGMGFVYRAFDPVFERQVAIKTILGDNIPPEQWKRFLREIWAAGRLSHANIVMSLDAGQDGGTIYVVMELIEGCDLGKMLRSGSPVRPERILEILSAVAAALDHAHSKGIVHRDVKPANIMVGADGSVKLADFGIAKLLDRESITPKDGILGTIRYIAPELWKGGRETGGCDQFSLAVVAYEALVGCLPFQGESVYSLSRSIMEDAPASSTLLSNETEGVLGRALSKEPAARFDSCAEFVAALAATLVPTPPPDPPSTIVAPPRQVKPDVELAITDIHGHRIELAKPGIAYSSGYGPSLDRKAILIRRGVEEARIAWSSVDTITFRPRHEKNAKGTDVWRYDLDVRLRSGKQLGVEIVDDWNMAYMGGGGTGLLHGETDLGETTIRFCDIQNIQVLASPAE